MWLSFSAWAFTIGKFWHIAKHSKYVTLLFFPNHAHQKGILTYCCAQHPDDVTILPGFCIKWKLWHISHCWAQHPYVITLLPVLEPPKIFWHILGPLYRCFGSHNLAEFFPHVGWYHIAGCSIQLMWPNFLYCLVFCPQMELWHTPRFSSNSWWLYLYWDSTNRRYFASHH